MGSPYRDPHKARKIRSIIVYTCTTVFFLVMAGAILYGLRPMLLPFGLGAFLAYLFKPLVSYRGTVFKKYARGFLILALIATGFYMLIREIRSNWPSTKEKMVLQTRLQYRFNDRFDQWMGLKDGAKGNYLYRQFGEELGPLRARVNDSLKLSDEERDLFLLYHDANSGENPVSDKYYDYYLENLKRQKIDIEQLKAHSKVNGQPPLIAATEESNTFLASVMKTISNWLIFPLTFIFILFDKGQIKHFFMRMIPNRYFELAYSLIENVDEALGKYIRGTLIECLLVGITLILGFYICGMDLRVAAAIGAVGGITNAIPFVGTFIACVIGAAYALIAESISPLIPFINPDNLMLAVVGVVTVAHIMDNAVYQPLVVGHAVNLHPLAVIIGVFGGSMMFGFAGLIFAIPTIVITKVVIETLFIGLKDYRII